MMACDVLPVAMSSQLKASPFTTSLRKERISFSICTMTRGEKEVIMMEINFTRMTFPEKWRTTGWVTKLKKALYKMKTNVDNFSLLVFLKAGREGAPLTRPAL